MEPTIKYEACDDLYPSMAASVTPQTTNSSVTVGASYLGVAEVGTTPMKRNYPDITNHIGQGAGAYGYSDCQMQESYRSLYAANAYTQHAQFGVGGMGKRYRKNPEHVPVIFRAPFFEMQEDNPDEGKQGIVTARCHTCKVVLRGQKNISSNFLKHMKRGHPEVYKIYENIKMLRRGRYKDQHTDNDQSFLDTSVLLEHFNVASTAYDEDDHSEHTERSIATPPNSTEASETPKTSTEAEKSSECSDKRTEVRTGTQTAGGLCQQTLEKVSQLLDEKLKHLVSRTELNETVKQIHQKRESVSSSNADSEAVPDALQSQLQLLQQECRELRSAMRSARQSKRNLQRELYDMHKNLHQNKLIVRNLSVEESQTPHEAVEHLLHERLQLPAVAVNNVNALNKGKKRTMLLVELANERDMRSVFQNCHKLKSSGIFIEPKLTPWARRRRAKLLVLRKELLRRKVELRVHVRDVSLIVAGRNFYWDEAEGLCVEQHTDDDDATSAVAVLNSLTGLDLTEFLNVLKHYDVQTRQYNSLDF